MKTRSFLLALTLMLFAAVSCTNDKQTTTTTATDVTIETRGVSEAPKAHVAGGKFQSGNTWINMKIDGTFEASFDGGVTVVGNWTLENNDKTLKLNGSRAAEGKGQSFAKEFTIIELSDVVMKVAEADGKTLELKKAE
jgi:hypothetical protein